MNQFVSDSAFQEELALKFRGVYLGMEGYNDGRFYTKGIQQPLEMGIYMLSDFVHQELSAKMGRDIELIWAPFLPGISTDNPVDVNEKYLRAVQSIINHGKVLNWRNEISPVFERVFFQSGYYFRDDNVKTAINKAIEMSCNPSQAEKEYYISMEYNVARIERSVRNGRAFLVESWDTNDSGAKIGADLEIDTRAVGLYYDSSTKSFNEDHTWGWLYQNSYMRYYNSFNGGMNMTYAGSQQEMERLVEYLGQMIK
ncbi:MAG: hypothetical protein HFI90_01160 [Clostridia bacterium]|nr:hypothetical protein [Clostridia bacterium]